jgi:hypothetical protein
MSKKNKLIICSGDSFTFGDELGVEYLVPGYTANLYPALATLTPERKELQKKLDAEVEKIWKNIPLLYPKYEKECNSRAWPSHLEKITDYKIVNCSRGGISNDEIVHRSMIDFQNQKLYFDPKNITIIMMLTNIHRVGYPVYGHKYGKYNFQSFMSSTSISGIQPSFMRHLFDFYFTRLKDYDHFWNSARQIIAAKHYFESYGSRVIFVDSCLWQQTIEKIVSNNKEEINQISSLISIEALMSNFSFEGECILPGYHYNETVHQKFAEYLATIL